MAGLEQRQAWFVRGFFDGSTVFVRRDRYQDGSPPLGCCPITITQNGQAVTAWLTFNEAEDVRRAIEEALSTGRNGEPNR